MGSFWPWLVVCYNGWWLDGDYVDTGALPDTRHPSRIVTGITVSTSFVHNSPKRRLELTSELQTTLEESCRPLGGYGQGTLVQGVQSNVAVKIAGIESISLPRRKCCYVGCAMQERREARKLTRVKNMGRATIESMPLLQIMYCYTECAIR